MALSPFASNTARRPGIEYVHVFKHTGADLGPKVSEPEPEPEFFKGRSQPFLKSPEKLIFILNFKFYCALT